MGKAVSPARPVFKVRNKKPPKKESQDAQERITCPGSCPCSTCKSPCTCTCTCSSNCTPPSPCPCSSGTFSPCSARPDGPDGSHSWWSCCRLCCGPCCRQRHHRDVLRRFLRPCTSSCSSCPCTSCSCSSTQRADRTLRLGDQTVPAVQPDPVRHHQL